ncbi:LLM class flavin-dependent oxidoreductase [Klebsiella grimontii]|uniref:LLM class flavin-dependent oxidoreductase n=1 Tax=Klebsiella grimontii TaxID=2058152 RepID=UPI0029280931|nr:LLM class flavin-dependent oxidoreductase [Klebsiella grimontii]MDV0418481.1 LLM class flavin-dependent oxidoreductase [Klebsiella grimontii]
MTRKRLGFFTRLLDHATPKERYRLATEQIRHAERLGFDSAWIAQHHFHEHEGGLPSPLVFLAHAAAHTERIRLGTAIITLPMENPLRVAEDAAVLDLLADGRLEVGFGSGGTPTSFLPFGLTIDQRSAVFAEHLHLIQSAWRGDSLAHPDNHLYPQAPQLAERIWIATFSVDGAVRAAQAGQTDAAARRDSESDYRRLSRRAARGRRAKDPRLAYRLRRRQPGVRATGRRTRFTPAGSPASRRRP